MILSPLSAPIVTREEPKGLKVVGHDGWVQIVFDNGDVVRLTPDVARTIGKQLERVASLVGKK